MQIVEKAADGLSRTYGVTIPAATLSAALNAKIAEIAPQMQIKGFRKGKVPAAHVRRMYGKSIMNDVVNDALQDGVNRAINDNGVRPASQPEVTAIENYEGAVNGGDLTFTVELDIMPTFEPVDIATLELERPVAKADEAEVERMLGEIASQSKTYETKDGAAADGDQVVIDFLGKVDGVPFDGGKAEGATLVLGSNTYIPGFEAQLVGAKAGDERVLNVTFPAEYGVATLAGKDATFEVVVQAVKAPAETVINDEWAKTLGLGDLAALRDVVAKNIETQLGQLSRAKAKRNLLDALDAAHSFELPPRMVKAEFEGIWQQVTADREAGNVDPEDAGKSDEELKAEYTKIAERRVRLGLVLAEVGRVGGVEVKDEEVARAMQAEAMRYPGQEQRIYEFFQKNPGAVASLRAPLYEEKVVDFVLQMAKVTDVEVSRAWLEAEDGAEAEADAKAKAEAESSAAAKPAKKPAKAKAKKAEADAPAEAAVETPVQIADEAPKPKKAASKKKATKAEAES